MVRIAVIGAAGRMGRMIIQSISRSADASLVGAADAPDSTLAGTDAGILAGVGSLGVELQVDLDAALQEADVAIDFTFADALIGNLDAARRTRTAMVIGTTGLDEHQKAALESAADDIPLVFAPNMSTGVNVFWRLIEEAARLLPDYDAEILEAHHNRKKDAPSGTAMRMAEILCAALDRDPEQDLVYHRQGMTGERNPREIGVQTIRGGGIVGDHTAFFCGPAERIEITHRAQGREAFADGAVRAAIWLADSRPRGMYNMYDVLGLR